MESSGSSHASSYSEERCLPSARRSSGSPLRCGAAHGNNDEAHGSSGVSREKRAAPERPIPANQPRERRSQLPKFKSVFFLTSPRGESADARSSRG